MVAYVGYPRNSAGYFKVQHFPPLPPKARTSMPCVVICREDRTDDGLPGPYSLATAKVFATAAEATEYAAGINPSREPMVIPGAFDRLRFG